MDFCFKKWVLRITIVVIGVLFSTNHAEPFAEIRGQVKDKMTNRPLSQVNILLVGSDYGTATNAKGQFKLTDIPAGTWTIEISAIGYKKEIYRSVQLEADKIKTFYIEMEPTVIEMDQLVVTATRNPMLLQNVPDVMMVSTDDEIRSMGANQVSDVVQYMPGVSTEGGTGSGQPFKRTVSLNGLPAHYSIVMVDGTRALSSHIHTGANVNIVPPENIKRIELVKGAASAQYGMDGIGGVMNIITRDGGSEPNLRFTSYGGSRNTFHTGLSITGSINKNISHSLFSSWEQSDGVPIQQPVFRKDNLNYSLFNLMDRMDIRFSDRIRGLASIHYLSAESPYRDDPYSSWLFTPRAELLFNITDQLTLSTSAYYSQWKSERNTELNEITSPQATVSYNGLTNHRMLFGVEYMLRNFHRKRVPERDQQSFGLFLQDRINLSSMWSLLAAVRLDKVEGIDAVMSPKISTLYRPIAPLALRASIGRGFRAPTVQDLYETLYTHPGDIHYRAGNPDLEPEYSTSITSGIEWTPFRQLSMMLNGYYYQIDNMITPIDHGLEDPTLYFPREQIPFVRDSLVYVYRRENIHHAVIGGGELKMMWNFAPGYSLEGGVTLIHNENKDTGESLPYYPGKSFSFKFTGVQSIGSRVSVKGFVGLNAAQDRKIWRFKHSGEQIVKLNNFQKLDAGLSLLFSNSYELFVNADNLLGQDLYMYEDLVFQIEGTPLFRAGFRLSM